MSLYAKIGSPSANLSAEVMRETLFESLNQLGPRKRVLAVPPDMSRLHSCAGELTASTLRYYSDRLRAVLPALGTHFAMTPAELDRMFSGVPHDLFRVHNWRTDAITLGEVPAEFIREQSEGKLDYSWPAQINRMIPQGGFDLVLSIGQVVPHEVIGMANQVKNLLIGTGGPLSINRSHYLGAVYGMERIMGRADTPVRRLLNYAADRFLKDVPIVYVLTVVSNDASGTAVARGLFIGDDDECFRLAAELSLAVNFEMLEQPVKKAVVYLDPAQFKSTWLGNKAIYRTRMALADGAELIVLAPGVKQFGEDSAIDQQIRKYGYRGTPATLASVARDPELAASLSAAAHLIHGSTEGRFTVTYCPGGLSREEIEGVGFRYADLDAMTAKYNPAKLHGGINRIDGEEVFFTADPALGLWAHRGRFASS